MKFMEDKEFNTLADGYYVLPYEKKLELAKRFVNAMVRELSEATLRENPNTDRSYLKQAAANCFGTMIAYSAGGNGGYSQKEYKFCRDLFEGDYDMMYHLSLYDYDAFCQIMDGYKVKFWTDNLIELSKYMDAQTKKNIATFMLAFSGADGEVVGTEKKSILDFLNRFY